jgi:Ion channel
VSDRQLTPARDALRSECERTTNQGRFGLVLLLLVIAVFFSRSAPDEPWAVLLTNVVLAANLGIAMLASGARPKVVRAWWGFAGLGVGVSFYIAITQEPEVGGEYLAITSLLLTLVTLGAIARRLWLHAEISLLTDLGALCIYVLVGLSFAFLFEAVGYFGSQLFFASQERGSHGDFVYFSFITMATVGYGDLTPQGGVARALAVTEGLMGQIYLVTAVAALVSNIGRTRIPPQGRDKVTQEEDFERKDGH